MHNCKCRHEVGDMNQAMTALLGALIGGGAAIAAQVVASSMVARQASRDRISEVTRDIRKAVEAELESGRELQLWARFSIQVSPEDVTSRLVPVGTVIPRLRERPDWQLRVEKILGPDQEEYDQIPLLDLLRQHGDHLTELANAILSGDERDTHSDRLANLTKLEDAIRRRMDIISWKRSPPWWARGRPSTRR